MPELNTMSKRGEWVAMGELITDEMLDAFAVVAPPYGVADVLRERFGDLCDRISFNAQSRLAPEINAMIVAALRG
jgi:hypothetical protein